MIWIASSAFPTVPNNVWLWLTCFVFFGFGFVIAVSALYYASKSRTQPGILLRALGGGFLGSTTLASLSAAFGTSIEGLPFPMTWAQAGILTATGFLVGAALTVVAGVIYVHRGILRPVRQRFGEIHAAVGWITLFAGAEPLGSWLQKVQRSLDMDDAWDEFTAAALDFFRKLDADDRAHRRSLSGIDPAKAQPRSTLELFFRALEVGSANAPPGALSQLDARRAMDVVRPILQPLVETLTSRLRRNSLNFTVWRVHASKDELEHLTSFPFERGEGPKEPLAIWRDSSRTHPAACGAEAMLARTYLILDEESRRHHGWLPRRLGTAYTQVGCMPIPADGREPWGVLCAEIREGQLPLSSVVMKMVLRELSDLIDRMGQIVACRFIDCTRINTERLQAVSRTVARGSTTEGASKDPKG